VVIPTRARGMSDGEKNENPDAGFPADGETLPQGAPTAGDAALRNGDVEVEGPKAGNSDDAAALLCLARPTGSWARTDPTASSRR
jgi:hypothetical protein